MIVSAAAKYAKEVSRANVLAALPGLSGKTGQPLSTAVAVAEPDSKTIEPPQLTL